MKTLLGKIVTIMMSAVLFAPLTLMILSTQATAASTNLIANPAVESELNGKPLNWTTNSWGANTAAFNYATGRTGKGLSVTVTNHSSGDAKWMVDQVAVTAGQTYVYTDYSKSNTMTEIDAAYTDASGNMSFVYLDSIPASDTWQQTTSTFTVPTGVVSVSIYHIVYSNGTLHTDDFSLTALSQPSPTPSPSPTPTPSPSPSPTNLINNPSFETANGTEPAEWNRGGWGTNTPTMTYASGNAHTGSRSATVSLANVTTGDAKWFANPVAVTPGTSYTYQDYYKASVGSRVVLAMTNTNGTASYSELVAAPAASNWTQYKALFTVPTGVSSLTIYHLLDQTGNLTIDDVSLAADAPGPTPTPSPSPTPVPTPSPTPTPGSNTIVNPSFETANGAVPAGWQADKWGTNTAAFTHVRNDAHTGTSSSKVTITNYVSGDAKWSFTPITSFTPGGQYNFSAWYKTNTQAHVVATYTDAQGVDQYLTLPNPLPGSNATTTWQQYNTTLNIPIGAKTFSVYFLIASNGWLQTDDFSLTPSKANGFTSPMISLTFDDGWSSIYANGLSLMQKYGFVSTQYLISGKLNTAGYMTTAQAQSFLSAGHEIASHTVTHPDLTLLNTTQLNDELRNSQSTLRQLFGANTAQGFASPTGTYNATTLAAIKQYYQSHRSTDVGFNTKDNFNPFNIVVQNITTSTTSAEVAQWVASAKTEKSWLVIVYHAVSNEVGDEYSVSPADLDEQLKNIQTSGVEVKTISQALTTIQSQL